MNTAHNLGNETKRETTFGKLRLVLQSIATYIITGNRIVTNGITIMYI